MAPSQTVVGRISWVRPDTDFHKYTSIIIAPVTIYGGTDTDWGNTSGADRTNSIVLRYLYLNLPRYVRPGGAGRAATPSRRRE